MLNNRRNFVFKVSIVINIAVLLYAAMHLSSSSTPEVEWMTIEDSEKTAEFRYINREEVRNETDTRPPDSSVRNFEESTSSKTPSTMPTTNKTSSSTASVPDLEKKVNSVLPEPDSSNGTSLEIDDEGALSPATLAYLRTLLACNDRDMLPQTVQRGDYWVLKNFVRGDQGFVKCHESITYTTHAGFEFLDNVLPLVESSQQSSQGSQNIIIETGHHPDHLNTRHTINIIWMAPVSLAIYAPGTDMAPTVNSIRYLRDCLGNQLIKQYVTFHVFFSYQNVPSSIPNPDKFIQTPYNCTDKAPYDVNANSTYMKAKSLLYPVNVARNIAREAAVTHYILPSDIELYPSPNLVPRFLNMIARNAKPLSDSTRPRVFPISIFEVGAKVQVPSTKTELRAMLSNKTAIPFHKFVCPDCHNIPEGQKWMSTPESHQMDVFHVGKRRGKFVHWEPIFIGTHQDPYYDERLSWEGKNDKITQGYILCLKDYDFMILNDAFLIHKPGIKHYIKNPKRDAIASRQSTLIKNIIIPQLKTLFGTRTDCAL